MTILFHVAKSSFEQSVQSKAFDLCTRFLIDYLLSVEFTNKNKHFSENENLFVSINYVETCWNPLADKSREKCSILVQKCPLDFQMTDDWSVWSWYERAIDLKKTLTFK